MTVAPTVKPRLRHDRAWSEAIKTIVFVVVVTVLFDMAIPRSLVDGRSMLPTFEDRERLIVSRIHYLVDTPSRGDIVVFNAVNNNQEMLIKRVIGVPGDTIEWRDRQLYINDVLQRELYTNEPECITGSCADRTWSLAEDEYFVMGDNRNHSSDSRNFGAVPIDHIVGQVILRYWPPTRLQFMNFGE